MATKITTCDCCQTQNVICSDTTLFEHGHNDTITNWYCHFCEDTGLAQMDRVSRERITPASVGLALANALGKIYNKLERLEQRLIGKEE